MIRSSLSAFLVLVMFAVVHGGELQVKTIASKALDREVKINVLLPDGYGENAERRYPTVYLLHGYGGDYTEWERVGIVDEAKGLQAIIAMPEGDQSFYINQHGKPTERWEDYVVDEVIGFVEKNYRTVAGRKGRAVSGLSMGGYGAVMLGLRHPQLFASIASHSGALGVPGPAGGDGRIAKRLDEIFGPADSEERGKYNLVKLIRELPKTHRPDVYIDCGSSDFLLNDNRDFVAELSGLKVAYEYREVPGAHNFEYWKRNVRYSLEHQLAALQKWSAVLKERRGKPRAKKSPLAKITGEWDLLVDLAGTEIDYVLKLENDGGKLKATIISPRSGPHPCQKASFEKDALRLDIDRNVQGQDVTFVYKGKLIDGKLSGEVEVDGFGDFSGDWIGTRKKKEEK